MKAFRTISAVVLAILVLVSSTSFMIGMHRCMGEIKNIALFSKADGCEQERSLPPCHRHMKAPCCEDETVILKAEDLKASAVDISIVPPTPIDAEQPLLLISEIVPIAFHLHFKYYNYDPPLRSCDLTIEHQAFLI